MAVERTLILVKPDAVERGLAGEIVARFENRGFAIRAAKLLRVSRDLADRHYAEHAEKPFFGELVEFAPETESQHFFYLFRLAAFVLIIAAVVDRNRR